MKKFISVLSMFSLLVAVAFMVSCNPDEKDGVEVDGYKASSGSGPGNSSGSGSDNGGGSGSGSGDASSWLNSTVWQCADEINVLTLGFNSGQFTYQQHNMSSNTNTVSVWGYSRTPARR